VQHGEQVQGCAAVFVDCVGLVIRIKGKITAAGQGFSDVVRIPAATVVKNDGSRGELETAINGGQLIPVDAGVGACAGL
jgi:hypothetical protein